MIFNLQRYSTHDGPGIRTVIFFKGCSLSCFWCQNPESQSLKSEILYDKRLCIHDCQLCVKKIPQIFNKECEELTIDRAHFNEQLIENVKFVCPSLAISVCGEPQTVDEIMVVVNKDAPFYLRTNGGVTISGGEPFMQPDLIQQILQRCKEKNYHTAVETCLHVPWKYVEPSLPYLDLFLADLKHTDEKKFKEWTNGSVKRILDNFRQLSITGKAITVRVPIIQGFNADKLSMRSIIDFAANEITTHEIHFLPYHTLGINKYKMLDMPYYAPTEPLNDNELVDYAMHYAAKKKLTAVLRG